MTQNHDHGLPNDLTTPGKRLYASLIGPLLGCYYPCPPELPDEEAFRIALNQSKLWRLWFTIYTEEDVDKSIKRWGGIKLDVSGVKALDYNYDDVMGRRAS